MILLGTMSSNHIASSHFVGKNMKTKYFYERIFCIFDWTMVPKKRFVSSQASGKKNILSILLDVVALMALTTMSCLMVIGFLNLPTTTKILHHNDGIVWFKRMFMFKIAISLSYPKPLIICTKGDSINIYGMIMIANCNLGASRG